MEPKNGPEMDLDDELCAAAAAGDVAKVGDLLAAGADASYFDGAGETPLMHAARVGDSGSVRLLLEAGAPWNAVSPSGISAGDIAMDRPENSTFEVLLDHALRSELVLGAASRSSLACVSAAAEEGSYLKSRIAFGEDRIMDVDNKAVMMQWERPLMEAHARAVTSSRGHGTAAAGIRVLNVGFGMGLVDEAIQKYAPEEHVIVEAHPEVYERMVRLGWDKKKGVAIVFGKWQDVVSQLGSFDGIFFDTYGEYHDDMREFHQHLPQLLKPGGIYSYFNGLCGDNAFFHVVYCHLVSLELGNLGYSTEFVPLPIKDCISEEIWEGVKHKYWQLDTYFLPVCQPASDSS